MAGLSNVECRMSIVEWANDGSQSSETFKSLDQRLSSFTPLASRLIRSEKLRRQGRAGQGDRALPRRRQRDPQVLLLQINHEHRGEVAGDHPRTEVFQSPR